MQNEMKNVPNRTKLIFSMLRRFEVWTSKIVAQDQLVTPTRLLPEAARSKTDQCGTQPGVKQERYDGGGRNLDGRGGDFWGGADGGGGQPRRRSKWHFVSVQTLED